MREACSAIVKVEARDVGGLGGAGIVEALFEEDILTVNRFRARLWLRCRAARLTVQC